MASSSIDHDHDHIPNRPPVFRGHDYDLWKIRMIAHLKSFELCDIVNTPLVLNVASNATREKNDRAINFLFCGLSGDELRRVYNFTTANEIWVSLENTHEGLSDVKKTKLRNLDSEFERFRMHNNEDISSMYKRFLDLTNAQRGLGKSHSNLDLVHKILRSLPKKDWGTIVTILMYKEGLETMTPESLFATLKNYEMNQLASQSSPPKDLALKAKKKKIEESDESDDESEDEEINILTSKMKDFLKERRRLKKKEKGKKKKEKKDKNAKAFPTIWYSDNSSDEAPDMAGFAIG